MREFPIGRYFVDFACREAMVVVEIDGATHSTDVELRSDAVREAYLLREGWRVFRVHNGDVRENLDGVCRTLLALLERDGG